jgi:tetratricopeptide (TPR) repeat protein
MKASKREARKPRPAPAPAPVVARSLPWAPVALVAGALLAVFWAYAPAAPGPFLFDDNTLPFALPQFGAPLYFWIHTLRPVLNFSYWINARISTDDTYSYHLFNVGIHLIAGVLIFLIVLRLLRRAGVAREMQTWLAGFAGAVFLLHPVQAESVAYLAGRSEALSDMLMLGAFAVFLYRRSAAVSWPIAVAVSALFVVALLAKEQTIALAALFILTDIWWDPEFSWKPVFRNWRLYGLLVVGAAVAVVAFLPFLGSIVTAGFGIKDLPWWQYLFTQFRALFVYIGLFVFPAFLTADWDFPISRTILDHGAIWGLLVLAALMVLAWRYRRPYRLASYGFFVFLVLMAPTSSILPIRDPVAERRLYAAMFGLLLIVVDFLSRLKLQRKSLAAVCSAVVVALAVAAHARAEVWSSARNLWEDTARKSPNKARVHFQLATAYCGPACGGSLQEQTTPRCDLAVQEYQRATQLQTPGYDLLVDWGAAYDCLNQPDKALEKLREAAALQNTAHVYTQIAKVYAEHQNWSSALEALATAEKLDPNYAVTYAYRGKVHLINNQPAAAVADYQRALALNPDIPQGKEELAQAQARLRDGQ